MVPSVTISPPTSRPLPISTRCLRVFSRAEVEDVLVEVTQHDNPGEWPVSDTVWIITSASPENVRTWLGKRFQPDELLDGWTGQIRREHYDVPEGMRPIGVWWD